MCLFVWISGSSLDCGDIYQLKAVFWILSSAPQQQIISGCLSVHTWHWNLCCDCYSVTIMSLVTDPCNVISNGGTRCNYVKLVDLLSQTFLRLSANLSCVHLSCSPRLQFSVSSFVLLLEECSRVVVFLPSPGRCGVLFIENFTISSRELEWILNDEHKLFLFVRKF